MAKHQAAGQERERRSALIDSLAQQSAKIRAQQSQLSSRPETVPQGMRNPLTQSACIHEDKRRPIGQNVPRHPIVDLTPHLAGRDGAEFIVRHFHA